MNVGGNTLPVDISAELYKLILKLDETHEFNNGTTAAYWDLVYTLTTHLKCKKNLELNNDVG